MAWQHAIGSRDPIRRHSGAGVLHVALELGLDKYTADYAACRWRRTEAIGSGQHPVHQSQFGEVRRLAEPSQGNARSLVIFTQNRQRLEAIWVVNS